MGAAFSSRDRDALARAGWDVSRYDATRWETNPAHGRALARLDPAGRWTVHHVPHESALAFGQDQHPCGAACDANEILWAWRDGRRVPDHLRAKLTDAGRAVL